MGASLSCGKNVGNEYVINDQYANNLVGNQAQKPSDALNLPVHKRNSRLGELRNSLAFARLKKNSLDNIQNFDYQSERPDLTNQDFFPNLTSDDQALCQALERKASFLIVRDILKDIGESKNYLERNSQISYEDRLLLTAQMEALHAHVVSGKAEIERKIINGERIRPLVMNKKGFADFLVEHKLKLDLILRSCRMVSPYRNQALECSLRKLSVAYLTQTNRMPSYTPGGPFTRCMLGGPTMTKINDEWGVGMLNDDDRGLGVLMDKYNKTTATITYSENLEETSAGALIIMAAETDPSGDPKYGRPNEKFYVSGFEHCTPKHRQAIAFILDLFNNLGCLELMIAHFRDKNSHDQNKAELAFKSTVDSGYAGSEEIEDSTDEPLFNRPNNQRQPLVDAVVQLQPIIRTYNQVHRHTPMLTDPVLNNWTQSPQFKADLDGLTHPETRAWTLNVERVKEALLNNSIFSPNASANQSGVTNFHTNNTATFSRSEIKRVAIECQSMLEGEYSDRDLQAKLEKLDRMRTSQLNNNAPGPSNDHGRMAQNAGAVLGAGVTGLAVGAVGGALTLAVNMHGIPMGPSAALQAAKQAGHSTHAALKAGKTVENFGTFLNRLTDKQIVEFTYANLLCGGGLARR